MERFAHRAEHALQPRRLRRCDAHRHRRRCRIEPQQVAGRGRCADSAVGRRVVPAPGVVRRAHEAADPTLGLEARGERLDQALAVDAGVFAERQHGRRDRHGRVTTHREIDVVEVERMRHRAIEQRRLPHRHLGAAADDCRLRGAAFVGDVGCKYFGEWFVPRSERHAEPVEQAMSGDRLRRGRDLVVAQTARFLGERQRQVATCGARGFPNGLRCSHRLAPRPLVPAEAGTQALPNHQISLGMLDSRFRGNERTRRVVNFVALPA